MLDRLSTWQQHDPQGTRPAGIPRLIDELEAETAIDVVVPVGHGH